LATSLVVSQIAAQLSDQFDEFVEIYNPTLRTIETGGATVWYRAASGPGSWLRLVKLPAMIAPRRYVLAAYGASPSVFAGKHQGHLPDLTYTAGRLGNAGGQVLVWGGDSTPPLDDSFLSSPLRLDFVGYGSATKFEGSSAASAAPNGQSIVRKASLASTSATMMNSEARAGNRVDTDTNGSDFVVLSTPVLRNSDSPPAP
jgi:hypothetical protein